MCALLSNLFCDDNSEFEIMKISEYRTKYVILFRLVAWIDNIYTYYLFIYVKFKCYIYSKVRFCKKLCSSCCVYCHKTNQIYFLKYLHHALAVSLTSFQQPWVWNNKDFSMN